MIQKISDFVHTHEKLLLGTLFLGILLFLGNKWLDHSAIVAGQEKAVAQAALDQQKAIVLQLTASLKDSEDSRKAAEAQANARIADLGRQLTSLQNNLLVEQQSIKTKPVSALTDQWNVLIQIPNGILNTNDGILVSEPAARATVSQLVEIPELHSEVTNYQNTIAQKDIVLVAKQESLDKANDLIGALNTKSADQDKLCKKDVADAKAVARKSKRNWFIGGATVATVARIAIKLALGF